MERYYLSISLSLSPSFTLSPPYPNPPLSYTHLFSSLYPRPSPPPLLLTPPTLPSFFQSLTPIHPPSTTPIHPFPFNHPNLPPPLNHPNPSLPPIHLFFPSIHPITPSPPPPLPPSPAPPPPHNLLLNSPSRATAVSS